MIESGKYRQDLDRDGICLRHAVAGEDALEELADALAEAPAGNTRSRGRAVYGIRNLLSAVAAVRRLAVSEEVRSLVDPVLGPSAFAVRGIFFDKTREANWRLGWHQDRAIPVKARADVDGFGPWSVKAGVPHVFPPSHVLEGMLTVRLHLDPCDATHGALRVIPGSHRRGLLSHEELAELVARGKSVACELDRGDVLVMRPLVAHASGKCERPGHRRVIHLEFANRSLPMPLLWNEHVAP